MSDTHYFSIDTARETTIKIRRSTFICRLEPVTDIEMAKSFIARVAKENKNATHNCWAYILGEKGEVFHSSDAGEPAGTAGKPMLNTLQSSRMSQVAAVVTRFYGGVKLGVRGLIEAYGESVQSAIDTAPLKKLVDLTCFEVELGYEFNDSFLSLMEPMIFQIDETDYSDKVFHKFSVESSDEEKVDQMLNTFQASGKLMFKTRDEC